MTGAAAKPHSAFFSSVAVLGGSVVTVGAGLSLAIPVGARFQFRNDGEERLEAVAVTMPPWPGAEEAVAVEGAWAPRV